MKMMTALVRKENGNLRVVRDDYFKTQKEFAEELRSNGFKVLKIWSKEISDEAVYEWEFLNRKH